MKTPDIDEVLGRMVDHRAIVVLRIAMGPLVLLHLGPFLAEAVSGRTYRDAFWVPYTPWMPQLPEVLYLAALWLAAVAAVLVSLGWYSRWATAYTAGFVLYNLFVSQTHYHHNRAFLAALLVGLALMPAGERISLDALRGAPTRHGRAGWGPQWPLLVLRGQIAAVYLASGLSKLVDPDWFGGVVTQLRVERAVETAGAPLPGWGLDLVLSGGFHSWFAKAAVLTELFIGCGLLLPRVRWAAVWVAVVFHGAIEVSADVQVFSYAALAALVVWVDPAPARRTFVAASRWWRRGVRALDWTHRFEVSKGPGLTLVESAGRRLTGTQAALEVLRLLPATFLIAAPLSVVYRRREAAAQPGATISSSRS